MVDTVAEGNDIPYSVEPTEELMVDPFDDGHDITHSVEPMEELMIDPFDDGHEITHSVEPMEEQMADTVDDNWGSKKGSSQLLKFYFSHFTGVFNNKFQLDS